MRPSVWKPLARGVVLESIRRKDVWVLAILGVLVVLAAGALGLVGIAGLEIFLKDLSVTVLSALSTVLAVLVSTRVLPEEIKNRTLYPLLARPVTRADLLIGKFLGSVLVSWAGFGLLCLLMGIVLTTFHVSLGAIAFQYFLMKCLGIGVVCSVGLGLSTVMTPQAAATMTFILSFGSAMLARALVLAGEGSPGIVPVCRVAESLLPQVHLFDLGARMVYINWSPVSLAVVLGLTAYACIYCSTLLFGGWVALRKRAF